MVLMAFVAVSQAMAPSFLIKYMAGNFKGSPEELRANLSPYALQILDSAFLDIDSGMYRDYHVHVVGNGEFGEDSYINSKFREGFHPVGRLTYEFYLSASGVNSKDSVDSQFWKRLVDLSKDMEPHGKLGILAFDKFYTPMGEEKLDLTEFYLSNKRMLELVGKYPDRFFAVGSVHPYKKNYLEELDILAKAGVRIIKWLPNAMGIQPDDKKLLPYYEALKKHNMVLLSHTGIEKAVEAEEYQSYGNPLRFKYPLSLGVKVIMGHCASLGQCTDFESENKNEVPCFDLFARMMEDSAYVGLLFGDISATTQFNRKLDVVETILDNKHWHSRLVNGSDYPLPGFNFIVSTNRFVNGGLLTSMEAEALDEIYGYNPLLFDFVLKRRLKSKKGNRLPASLFMENPELAYPSIKKTN